MDFINEMIHDVKEEFNNGSQHTTENYNNNELHTVQTKEHLFRGRNSTKVKLSLTNYISIILFGPFGQLYVRATKAGGSLDRVWLFLPLFWFPPLSLIPAYYLSRGKIRTGNDRRPIAGLSAIVVASVAFLAPFLMNSLELENMGQMMVPLVVYAASTIVYFMRNRKRCSKGGLARASYSSSLLLIVTTLFTITFKYIIGNIDGVGSIFESIYESPFLSNAMYACLVYTSYCAVNMYNNTPSLRKYCKKIKHSHMLYSLLSTLFIAIINPFMTNQEE